MTHQFQVCKSLKIYNKGCNLYQKPFLIVHNLTLFPLPFIGSFRQAVTQQKTILKIYFRQFFSVFITSKKTVFAIEKIWFAALCLKSYSITLNSYLK
jgi:hypothetical protein